MKRPKFFGPVNPETGKKTFPSAEWREAYEFRVEHSQYGVHSYCPTPKGLDFHESQIVNTLIEGSRGTGKSTILRNDAHMRALAYPGYSYLIVRRTMPELKKSHLKFMAQEMLRLGGTYHKTDAIAYYPNGSTGYFSHCETEDDMMKLLSSEYCAIYFDEITTFTQEMITKIASCVRVPEDSGLMAILRGGTNPIGEGADYVRRAYILKDIEPEEDPEYLAEEYLSIHTTLDDNPYIDKEQYIRRLSGLPDHVRRAWLLGEWVVEGAYFHDYMPTFDGKPWHVTDQYPMIWDAEASRQKNIEDFRWIHIYRCVDWGFSPDPAVCLWIAILPNGRAVVIKERHWKSKGAEHVAQCIKAESENMHVVDTFCDPSMFYGSESTGNKSIGDIFETNGVFLTPVKNDRAQAGYAIHEYLNKLLDDGLPKLQIYRPACPNLCKTIPEMRTHKLHPERIADGNDHWVISLAYFCMQWTSVGQNHEVVPVKLWMRPKASTTRRIGSESVRRRA